MKRELVSRYSEKLDRYMDLVVYGEGGYPVIVFPTQDSPCTNWEDFGLIETIEDYIGSGTLQLFCVSNVDRDSWSAVDRDKTERADLVEAYYRYVSDELCPLVHELSGSSERPLLAGCSMGATHAVVFALRRPDLFQGCIALSGVYDAKYFFDGWMNETLYASSPVDFLPNMAADHPYVDLYNKRQLVLCGARRVGGRGREHPARPRRRVPPPGRRRVVRFLGHRRQPRLAVVEKADQVLLAHCFAGHEEDLGSGGRRLRRGERGGA